MADSRNRWSVSRLRACCGGRREAIEIRISILILVSKSSDLSRIHPLHLRPYLEKHTSQEVQGMRRPPLDSSKLLLTWPNSSWYSFVSPLNKQKLEPPRRRRDNGMKKA